MLAGIRDILLISTPDDLPQYEKLLGNGETIGVNFTYTIQDTPRGLADAFILGEDFIGTDNVCLVLGDNIFYGAGLKKHLHNAVDRSNNGIVTLYGYYVSDPQRYGIVELDDKNIYAYYIVLNNQSNKNICYDNDICNHT